MSEGFSPHCKKSVKFNINCVDTEVTRRICVPWHTNSVSWNTFVSCNLWIYLWIFYSAKCLFRPKNWFLKVFSKKIFRSKITISVINENNSYHEYPNAKKFYFCWHYYTTLTLFLDKQIKLSNSINIDT